MKVHRMLVLLSSSTYCSTTQRRRVGGSRVGCFGSVSVSAGPPVSTSTSSLSQNMSSCSSRTRRGVQVQHCMFNFRTTRALHPRKIPWIIHRGYAQYDIDLPSESEGRRLVIVINLQRAKPLVHRPWTFPHQAERVRIRGHQREL